MMSRYFVYSMLLLSFVLTPSFVSAQPKLLPFEKAISAIDTVPTRTQLLKSYPNAEVELRRIAKTGEGWSRQRAISLLSFFPNPKSKALLTRIAKNESAYLSALATFTLTQSYRNDKAVLVLAEEVINNNRQQSIRLLILEGIIRMHLPARVAVLRRFAGDNEERVRRRSVRALSEWARP